jgi:hypothetical protein
MNGNRKRLVGRLLMAGGRDELVKALDALIEPKSLIWERISDVAIGYVVDLIIDARADIRAGAKEALDQLPD